MSLSSSIPVSRMMALLCLSAACTMQPKAELKDITIAGSVASERGGPIANASIEAKQLGVTVTSDAAGRYVLVVPKAKQVERLGLQVQANGYAQHVAYLQLTESKKQVDQGFLLRPIGLQQEVVLPLSGEAPIVLTLPQQESQMQLSIGDNTLIDKQGNVVTGAIQVSFTAFDAVKDRSVFPAALLARNSDPNGVPIPLVTYGMADIELRQAGELLQIAPGKTLGWTVQLSPFLQGIMQRYPDWHAPPAIYSLDEQTGLWVEEGIEKSGALSYNAEQGQFSALLPHLSTWNIDGAQLAAGGCVKGRVLDCKGNPINNKEVALWLLSWENLAVFRTTSNGAGDYCVNVGVSNGNLGPTPYVLTDRDLKTNMYNPIPAACSACPTNGYANCSALDWDCQPNFSRCNVQALYYSSHSCAYGNGRDYGVTNNDCSYAISQMGISDCTLKGTPSVLTLVPCSFCSGEQPDSCRNNNSNLPITNNCVVVDLQLPCNDNPPPKDPNSPNSECSGQQVPEGPCDPTLGADACCIPGYGCLDRLCLPL